MVNDLSHVDGRVLRGRRNRQAIVDALLDLYKEGVVDPTARQIAARAGVSTRSVFAHFEDRERLVEAVAASQEPIVRRLVDPDPPDTDLDGRIDWLARARAEYFEEAQSVIRAALRYRDEQPAIANRMHRDGLVLRGQVETVFAPELCALDLVEREARLEAADAIFSFELWRRLRSSQGLDARRTHGVICLAARRLLA
jgi:TetR/AcrR family transcriptional regulator, regulator of autoinduction and epiphytic fitness